CYGTDRTAGASTPHCSFSACTERPRCAACLPSRQPGQQLSPVGCRMSLSGPQNATLVTHNLRTVQRIRDSVEPGFQGFPALEGLLEFPFRLLQLAAQHLDICRAVAVQRRIGELRLESADVRLQLFDP